MGDKVFDALEQITERFQEYLDESSIGYDEFLEGLDVTVQGATDLFNDFLLYVNHGYPLPRQVKNPTTQS